MVTGSHSLVKRLHLVISFTLFPAEREHFDIDALNQCKRL